jgi:glucose-6-phosphate isomerase
MACFMYALAELGKHRDILEFAVTAVTDPADGAGETLLHRLARENGWQLFRVPDGVGGRFSVFSDVGLITAAAVGLDFNSFLAGAREMDKACQSADPFSNMALLNATLKFLAAEKCGRDLEVFMPYADSLKSLAEWYIQLLAESLGKGQTRDGRQKPYGRTPIVAVGTTDMHAQTQQHQEGKLNKVVQFVKVAAWGKDPIIPNCFPQEDALGKISGVAFSQALNAALEANAEALSGNGRFSAVFVLPELNLYYLGALMYLLALSVAYEGELADVDAFDQPGVEAYKKILKAKLASWQK